MGPVWEWEDRSAQWFRIIRYPSAAWSVHAGNLIAAVFLIYQRPDPKLAFGNVLHGGGSVPDSKNSSADLG